MIQIVVVLWVIYHFAGQVFALLDAIATYVDWYDYEIRTDLGQIAVAL